MKKKLKEIQGMTLIEIMVVIAIIGLIASVVTVSVVGRLEEARISTAKTQIKSLEDALDHFYRDAGFYPSTEQGLQALISKPTIGRSPQRYAAKGYLKGSSVPKDPWGCDFAYFCPGTQGHEYEIYSYGKDCQEGGDDADADIASFEIGQ